MRNIRMAVAYFSQRFDCDRNWDGPHGLKVVKIPLGQQKNPSCLVLFCFACESTWFHGDSSNILELLNIMDVMLQLSIDLLDSYYNIMDSNIIIVIYNLWIPINQHGMGYRSESMGGPQLFQGPSRALKKSVQLDVRCQLCGNFRAFFWGV